MYISRHAIKRYRERFRPDAEWDTVLTQLRGIANACAVFEETREGFEVGYVGDMRLVKNGDTLITITDKGDKNGRADSDSSDVKIPQGL